MNTIPAPHTRDLDYYHALHEDLVRQREQEANDAAAARREDRRAQWESWLRNVREVLPERLTPGWTPVDLWPNPDVDTDEDFRRSNRYDYPSVVFERTFPELGYPLQVGAGSSDHGGGWEGNTFVKRRQLRLLVNHHGWRVVDSVSVQFEVLRSSDAGPRDVEPVANPEQDAEIERHFASVVVQAYEAALYAQANAPAPPPPAPAHTHQVKPILALLCTSCGNVEPFGWESSED